MLTQITSLGSVSVLDASGSGAVGWSLVTGHGQLIRCASKTLTLVLPLPLLINSILLSPSGLAEESLAQRLWHCLARSLGGFIHIGRAPSSKNPSRSVEQC